MARPMPMSDEGSRVRVILGETGEDYLVILDHEDAGGYKWQTVDWSSEDGGLPLGLAQQLRNLTKKDRHATEVAFGPDGEWYVEGMKRDGSGVHAWWGGTYYWAEDVIKEASDRRSIAFGANDSYVFLRGKNGARWHGIDDRLKKQINRIDGRIDFVRLLRSGAYFISDSEGTGWKGCGTHLSEELMNGEGGGRDCIIHDVAEAGDGCWVVIRPNRYVSSRGVSDELKNMLTDFYKQQQANRGARNKLIREYDARVERKRVEREEQARRKREKEEEAQRVAAAAEEARRKAEEAEAKRRAVVKRRYDELDFEASVKRKQLCVSARVTLLGSSSSHGDARVIALGEVNVHVKLADGKIHVTSDPQLRNLIVHEPDGRMVWANEESRLVLLLCDATDKYESASSVYLCVCDAHVCRRAMCTRLLLLPGQPADRHTRRRRCVKVGTFPPPKLAPPGRHAHMHGATPTVARPLIDGEVRAPTSAVVPLTTGPACISTLRCAGARVRRV